MNETDTTTEPFPPLAYRQQSKADKSLMGRLNRQHRRAGLPALRWPEPPRRRLSLDSLPKVSWTVDNNVPWTHGDALDQLRAGLTNEPLRFGGFCVPTSSSSKKEVAARMKGNGEARFAWEVCRLQQARYGLDVLEGEPGDVRIAGRIFEVKELDAANVHTGFRIEGPAQEHIADFVDDLRILGRTIQRLAVTDGPYRLLAERLAQFKQPRASNYLVSNIRFGAISEKDVPVVHSWLRELEAEPGLTSEVRDLGLWLPGWRWMGMPTLFLRDWEALSGGLGAVLPAGLERVAIVYEKAGYQLIEPQDMGKYFRLYAIDRGKAINLKPRAESTTGSVV